MADQVSHLRMHALGNKRQREGRAAHLTAARTTQHIVALQHARRAEKRSITQARLPVLVCLPSDAVQSGLSPQHTRLRKLPPLDV